jgi:hypothetical protein
MLKFLYFSFSNDRNLTIGSMCFKRALYLSNFPTNYWNFNKICYENRMIYF